MTVTANDTIDRSVISGTGPYTFSFRIFATTDVTGVIDTGDLSTVALVNGTDFTVTPAAGSASGGTVTLTSTIATTYAGDTLDLRQNVPETQATSIRNQGTFLPSIHEDALDRLAAQIQALSRRVDRKWGYPDTTTLAGAMSDRASWAERYAFVNASGEIEPAAAVTLTTLTQSLIISLLNGDVATAQQDLAEILGKDRTDAEIAAGVTPTDFSIPSHEAAGVFYPARYGYAGDAASNGQSGTDDTTALRNTALVVNEVGGGTIDFGPGGYSRVFSATTGTLMLFEDCRGIHLRGNGVTLVVPTNKSITASEGYFFAFTNCTNISIEGFNTNGPTLDVSSSTVKGYEFAHFVGCEEISMPNNNVVNALAGATFYGQNGSGLPSAGNRSRNIHIGTLKVTNCWYGTNCQFSGDNMVIENLITDTVHRSIFHYGMSHQRLRLRSKNFKAKDVDLFSWHNGTDGTAATSNLTDIELDYTSLTDSDACATNGEHIYWGTWGTGAQTVSDIRIRAHVDYPGSGGGGNAVLLTKLNASFSPDTTTGRGHTYQNVDITCISTGTPDTTANGLVAFDASSDFAGETIQGRWNIAVSTPRSDGGASFNSLAGSAMTANMSLTLKIRSQSAPVVLQETSADRTLPHLPTIVIDQECIYTNRYSNVSGPILAHEYMNAGSATPTAYAGWCKGSLKWLTGRNAGGNFEWDLPDASVGMRVGLVRSEAGLLARFDPTNADTIRGVGSTGAGKFFQGGSDGATAILYCNTATIWDIEQQTGTWAWE